MLVRACLRRCAGEMAMGVLCLTFILLVPPGETFAQAMAGLTPGSPPAPIAVQLEPTKDNTLYESPTGDLSNGAGEHFFVGQNGRGENRRAIMAFDIAGSIPPGSTIIGATLAVNMGLTSSGPAVVELHRLLADWGEGASDALGYEGAGAAPAPGDATWLHTFYDTGFWASPGGDFAAEASASTLVVFEDVYTWSSAAMVSDVQAWLDAPATNFGWLLIGDETQRSAKRFDSRENADPLLRPVLSVSFLPGSNLPRRFFPMVMAGP